MKTLLQKIVALALCFAPSAYAASGAESDGTGIFFWLFIGFAAMIVVFQFLPGVMMFIGMAKGLFDTSAKETMIAKDSKKG